MILVNLDEVERVENVHATLKYLLERGCSERLFVKVLNMCPDPECDECGKLVCINGEPLHFHHDGCPGCDGTTNRFTQRAIDREDTLLWSADDFDLEPLDTRDDHPEPKEELGGADHAGR